GHDASSFAFASGQSLSFVIAPGATAPVELEFVPAAPELKKATLKITTNDPARPSVLVPLSGLDAADYEGLQEPTLSDVVRALGSRTDVGSDGHVVGDTRLPVGDEVVSPYWLAADNTQPVSFLPFARYSHAITDDGGFTGWYDKGSTTNNLLFAFHG